MRRKLSRSQFAKVSRLALKLRRDPRFYGKSRKAVALCAVAFSMNWFERATRHFILITRHKAYVFYYCCYAGLFWRGLLHDLSKYTPGEFFESVRYFNGRRSPVGLCREIEGYSFAWLHHKGRNYHHFEFWSDVVDPSGRSAPEYGQFYPTPMPFVYALESICDTIAASRAYNGKKFSYDVLYRWWQNRQKLPVNMHPETKRFADAMYEALHAENGPRALRRAKEIYNDLCSK